MYYNLWNKRKLIVAGLAAGVLLLGGIRGARAATDPTSCKRAVAKASADFERAKLKALQKCEDTKRKGKLAPGTNCLTEAKAAPKIATALTKLQSSISTACNGISLTNMGWDGSGTGGNPVLAKACNAGERTDEVCTRETDCPGLCIGGEKDGEGCNNNPTCAKKTCVHAKCIGGTQNGVSCDTVPTKASCEAGLGTCPWMEECDGGSSGALGVCTGGSNPGNTCGANSDCSGGGTCAEQCNTGNFFDCVAGYCQGSLCTGNSDCGQCYAGPNINQSCTSDGGCGLVCVGGSNAGTPCKGQCVAGPNAGKSCTANSGCPTSTCSTTTTDCTGGGTCPLTGISGACHTGTCTNGFCNPGAGAHARSTAGFCAPTDRCPNFENNKLPIVQTCDGGANNGKPCAVPGDCPSGTCNAGCSFALSTAADVANCLACIGEGSVDQVNALIYGDLKPVGFSCVGGANDKLPCGLLTAATDCPAPGKCKMNAVGTEVCKQGVGKAAAKFFDSKRAALQKCADTTLKTNSGTCPDTATSDKITAASDKLLSDIAKACGGKDKTFGGSDAVTLDQLPDSIGNLFNCNNLKVPGAATSCAGLSGRGPIDTADELAICIECLSEFKVDCTDRIATPSAGALYAECNPRCGNSQIDGHCSVATTTNCGSSIDCPTGQTCIPDETCDDGNSASGDTCPANCNVQPCTPSGTHHFMLISFSAPAGVSLAGLSVYAEYPDGTVGIPGQGNEQSVQDSLTVPFDGFGTINDLNYGVHIALLANPGATVSEVAAVVQMDSCTGASAPTNDQFRCSVESASDANSNAISGVTCAVTVF